MCAPLELGGEGGCLTFNGIVQIQRKSCICILILVRIWMKTPLIFECSKLSYGQHMVGVVWAGNWVKNLTWLFLEAEKCAYLPL